MLRKALLAIMLSTVLCAPALADCRLKPGTVVALYGTMDDPDVLVWDSQLRLKAYGMATFDESQALLAHALVAHPGTRARVVACIPHDVTTKFSASVEDSLELSIISGPLHGHNGWVIESAIREIPKSTRASGH